MRAARAVALMLAASLLGTVGWAAYRAHWRFAGASTCAEESPQTLFKESIIEFQSCYGRRAEVNPQDSWIVYRWGAKEKRVVWMSVPRDPKPPQGWSRIVDMLDEIRARAEKQEPIREALANIADGKLDPIPLSVTYDDMHGLWGGLTLTIHGNGYVRQKAVKVAVRTPTLVSRDGILKLVRLLLQERAWEQRESERAPEPDESQARLVVEYGTQRSEIWEWYNDLDKNQRVGKIRDLMKAIAF